MTFILYELDLYPEKLFPQTEMNFLRQGFRKLSHYIHTYRQTDIRIYTDRCHRNNYYHVTLADGKNLAGDVLPVTFLGEVCPCFAQFQHIPASFINSAYRAHDASHRGGIRRGVATC